MTKRYFIEEPLISAVGSMMSLGDQEAHHLTSVMRAKIGDAIVLFNGDGCEYPALLKSIEKKRVLLEVIARQQICREPISKLCLAVALPKGDRQQWLCEKLVELGCNRLTPLVTTRGVAEPGEAALARLRRYVIEASKQCGRNRLMEISDPTSLPDYLIKYQAQSQRYFLNASGTLLSAQTKAVGEVHAAIGPEGGWTEPEIAAANANAWQIVSLGSRILRVETAATAICSRLCTD